jgi:hypothetical protein
VTPRSSSKSWLTVLGHTKDSVWNLDLTRAEAVRGAFPWPPASDTVGAILDRLPQKE